MSGFGAFWPGRGRLGWVDSCRAVRHPQRQLSLEAAASAKHPSRRGKAFRYTRRGALDVMFPA
jgi:hypothetical protein